MNPRLALAAALAGPILLALCLGATMVAGPLPGAGLALLAYWVAILVAIRRWSDREAIIQLAALEWPGWLVAAAMALPVLVLGALTLQLLGRVAVPSHLVIAAALAALVHGVLEEAFWRGALVPDPTPRALGLALAIYAVVQAAWLGLQGVEAGPSPLLLVAGTVAMGGAWTASRLITGRIGAGILGHAALCLFLFVDVVARTAGRG